MSNKWSTVPRYCSGMGLIGVLFYLFALTVPGTAPGQNAPQPGGANEIRVGVLENFPPHYLTNTDTGKPEGFAIDIMDAVAREAGLSVKYVIYPTWPNLNAALQRREIDVIANIGITKARARWAAFTRPVETFPVSIFVREADETIRSADDLAGKRVSVRVDNVGVTLMKKYPTVDSVVHDTWEQALLALLSGDTDGFVYPKNVLLKLAQEAGLVSRIKAVEPPLLEIKRAIGVRPDRPELLVQLDHAVEALLPTTEYHAIFLKWYGETPPFWTIIKVIILMASLMATLVLVFFYWRYRSLKRVNSRLSDAIANRQQAEETLHLRNQAIENSANGIVITDVVGGEGRIAYVNPAFTDMTGYLAEELIGKRPNILRQGESKGAELAALLTALRENRPARATLLTYRKDGSSFWDEIHISQIRDDQGDVNHRIAIHIDISDTIAKEAALEYSRSVLQTMFATSPDGIITIDPKGTVLTFNPTAEDLFGYSEADVVGKNVKLLMPEPYQGEHDGYLARYLETGEKRIIGIGREVTAQRKDGTTFPMELAVGEMEIGGRKLFTGFIRDISRRRDAEERLELSQDRLKELQSEFVQVSRLSAMGEMAATLAHELNQPLSAMMNYAQATRRMLQASAAEDTVRLVELMTKAVEQATRAGEIIRRLRTFVAQGETEKSLDDISDVVNEACALALVGARSDGVETTMSLAADLPEVLMDRIQIQQVVVNLIRNSLDAMDNQERRTIAIKTAIDEDNALVVSVADNGPGLDEEIAEKLFQPFNSSKTDGMGIGLSISRTIIEQHGGRIWSTPNDGGGAIFSFTLPVEG
jgi:two-component system sensor kinase FixL